MTRCQGCSARPGLVCVRHRTGHARYCELMGDPAYRDLVERLSEEGGAGRGPGDPPCDDATPAPTRDPRLALVRDCPDRGSVLPHTLQRECGCGGELTECRAGKGKIPGRVTLAQCLECVSTRPASPE